MLTLLRDRPFAIFFTTQSLSYLGDAARQVILPLLVLQLTGLPTWVATITLLGIVPYFLLHLPFGALVDRWDRRRTILLSDLARGVLTLLIPLAAWLDGPLLWVIACVAVPFAALSSISDAAGGTVVPALLKSQDMDRGYALVEMGESLAWVAGPLIAGLLATWLGLPMALLVDGVSFIASAIGIASIRVPHPDRGTSARSLLRDVLDGLAFLVRTPGLRRVQIAWSLYGVVGYGAIAGLVFVGSKGGTAGAMLATTAVACYAGGSVLGTLASGAGFAERWPVTLPLSALAFSLGAAAVAFGSIGPVLGGALMIGLGEGFFLVVYLARRARLTPRALLGRIASAGTLLAQLASSLSAIWVGLALDRFGGTGAFALMAAGGLILAAVLARMPAADLQANAGSA